MLRTRSSSYVNVCDQCYRRKLGCSRSKPSCDRCHQTGRQCTYSLNRPAGRPRRCKSVRRDNVPFPASDVKDTRGKDGFKNPVYVDSEEVTLPTPNDGKSDAQPACGTQATVQPATPRHNGLIQPNGFGADGSESTLIDPAICSERPRLGERSAHGGMTSDHQMHGREMVVSSSHGREQPQSKSIEEVFRPVSRLETETTPRHTQIGTLPMAAGFAAGFETGMLDFGFESNEPYVMEHETYDIASVASSREEGCTCFSDIVQSLEAKVDLGHTTSGSLNVIRMLNEASEQLVHCNEIHSAILYSILLGIYEEAEDGLDAEPRRPGKSNNETYMPTPDPIVVSETSDQTTPCRSHSEPSSARRDIIFKAFTTLSMFEAALTFKIGTDLKKGHREFVAGYADSLRDRFRLRLIEGTS